MKKLSSKIIAKKIFTFILLSIIMASESFAMGIGSVGGRPAGQPYSEQDRSQFSYELELGAEIKDAITVVNSSDTQKTILVYPADGMSNNDGSFALKQKAETMMGVGNWIILEKSEVTIPPKGKETVPFTVKVPNEGVDVGEHSGGILIQAKEEERGGQGGVTLSMRVGIRMYIKIPGEVIEKIKYESFSGKPIKFREYFLGGKNLYFVKIPTSYEFLAKYKNEGNVSSSIKTVLIVKDVFNSKEERFEKSKKIARDASGHSNFEWENPRFGKFEIKAEVYLEEKLVATSETLSVWIIPWDIVAGIMLLIMSFVLIFISRKISRSSKGWGEYKVKKGETIVEIAAKNSVNWEKLAKVNNLKAPYYLAPGSIILLPPAKSKIEKPIKKSAQKPLKSQKNQRPKKSAVRKVK